MCSAFGLFCWFRVSDSESEKGRKQGELLNCSACTTNTMVPTREEERGRERKREEERGRERKREEERGRRETEKRDGGRVERRGKKKKKREKRERGASS